jgi:hypothetical protein
VVSEETTFDGDDCHSVSWRMYYNNLRLSCKASCSFVLPRAVLGVTVAIGRRQSSLA